MEEISWGDFERVELRVGTVMDVEEFPEARCPAYKLLVDFGEAGVRKSSAQITRLYQREELVGKQVIGVLNFPRKQIGRFFSEGADNRLCRRERRHRPGRSGAAGAQRREARLSHQGQKARRMQCVSTTIRHQNTSSQVETH